MNVPDKLPRMTKLLDVWRAIEQHHRELAGLYTLAHQITTGIDDVPPRSDSELACASSAEIIREAIEEGLGDCVGMN